MRKLFLSLLIALFAFSFIVTDANAKRFGGGRSFGASKNTSSFSSFNSNNASRVQPNTAPKPASTASRWLGPLAGLAIGGLLGSLFMGHGFGSGILSWLLIGGVIFLVWTFIRNRMQPAIQTMQGANNFSNTPLSAAQYEPAANNSQNPSITSFEEASFLRDAKVLFIRLQAAYDTKNLSDIREFTAPEVSAEVQLQLQERGNEPNHTEVINIDAKLLDMSPDSHGTVASALFSGLIREELGATPVAIKEIWHFRKESVRSNWVVTGIQQEG